ncbi:glycoside hydrolase family 31 protein [Tylopilus felleus]
MLGNTVFLAFFPIALATTNTTQPSSTGIKLQNERVSIQPYGNNGIRVRASLMRDPTGNELSALLDPPLQGPGGNQQINGSWTLLTQEFTDDKYLCSRYYVEEFKTPSFMAEFSFTSDPTEQFYGAGQQACCKVNPVNKKGQSIDLIKQGQCRMWPTYLQFFNMPSQGRIATVVDYYITTAELHEYTAVTGRQPTLPDFTLGYQQSKLRYWNQTQIMDLAQRFHDEQVDVSLIVVDSFNWKYQGDWSFNPEYWPDPALMAQTVKNLTGAEMMVSLWPSVEDLSDNYLALQEQGFLATIRDGTGLYDSTNPGAREFLCIGVMKVRAINEGLHNLTGQLATSTSCAYMSLTRSTFAGGQRYCSYMWSTLSEFNVLLQQIISGVSAAASGISSWTLDIGGFTGLDIDTEYGQELFVRWLGMGTFLPYRCLMSSSSSRVCNITSPSTLPFVNNCPNEPWSYGKHKYNSLHYQVVLHLKTLFGMLQATGRSIMRPLYYDFSLCLPDDPLVVHQFMLGADRVIEVPRLLVSPVGVQGATSKKVYLPRLPPSMQGMTWTRWWTDDYSQGGQIVNVSASLDQIPVFYLGNKSDIYSGNLFLHLVS